MPPRPSRGPTSLHLASLGSPFAFLTGLPSASSFCLPPAVLSLTPSHTRLLLSLPRLSRHARARARDCEESPLPHPRPPSRSHAPSFLFLLSAVASSPSLSAAPFARLDLTLLFPSRTLVLLLLLVPPRFLLVRPHRAFSSTVRVRGHGAPLRIISSRLPRLALAPLSLSPAPFSAPSSSSFLFLSACSPSAASSSFVLYSTLPPLELAEPLSSSPRFPCSCARRGINYSKNLYCYYYRLTQRFGVRDVHSSPVQCATLFAPCRLRQFDDSEGDDGDNGS